MQPASRGRHQAYIHFVAALVVKVVLVLLQADGATDNDLLVLRLYEAQGRVKEKSEMDPRRLTMTLSPVVIRRHVYVPPSGHPRCQGPVPQKPRQRCYPHLPVPKRHRAVKVARAQLRHGRVRAASFGDRFASSKRTCR